MKKNSLVVYAVITLILVAIATLIFRGHNRYAVPADWKIYSNTDFGVRFNYPSTWRVCAPSPLHPLEPVLDLYISQRGTCETGSGALYQNAYLSIHIDRIMAAAQQLEDPKDLAFDFSRNFGIIDLSINPQLIYFKLDGMPVYGGAVIRKAGQKPTDYIVMFVHKGNRLEVWDKNYQNHPQETAIIVHSLHFDSKIYPR